jgi:hypothetical protein
MIIQRSRWCTLPVQASISSLRGIKVSGMWLPPGSFIARCVIPCGGLRSALLQGCWRKINSTLRIGILMVQVDGERNYIAPALRTAPVFGGIAGIMAPEQADDEIGPLPSLVKTRDHTEVHDLYRRTLAASWLSQPGELPADECIEDLFSGGNGWRTGPANADPSSDPDDSSPAYDTLRPSDFRRSGHRRQGSNQESKQHGALHHLNFLHHHPHMPYVGSSSDRGSSSRHQRSTSASSDRSASTVVGNSPSTTTPGGHHNHHGRHRHGHDKSSRASLHPRSASRSNLSVELDDEDLRRSRSASLTSMASTLSSERAREHGGLKHVKDVHESEIREDLVAWRLPGMTAG